MNPATYINSAQVNSSGAQIKSGMPTTGACWEHCSRIRSVRGCGDPRQLGMATGAANLGIPMWEDSQLAKGADGSFSTRIDNLTVFIEFVCGYSSQLQAACGTYKQIVHPSFPGAVPRRVRRVCTSLTRTIILCPGPALRGCAQLSQKE